MIDRLSSIAKREREKLQLRFVATMFENNFGFHFWIEGFVFDDLSPRSLQYYYPCSRIRMVLTHRIKFSFQLVQVVSKNCGCNSVVSRD